MRDLVRVVVPEGEDEHMVWLRHKVAAISEGLCPYCATRLEPRLTRNGMGGSCPQHGVWHANPDDQTGYEMVSQWAHGHEMDRRVDDTP